MPTKLKFKGDKTKKKRKHHIEEEDDIAVAGPSSSSSSKKRKREGEGNNDGNDDTWVRPDTALEIRGPTFIYHPSDPHPVCISFDATRGRVNVSSLDKEKVEEEDEEETPDGKKSSKSDSNVLNKTPTDVSQVWVATRVAGSETITLRTGLESSTGSGATKFLSCDTHGLVSAYREARGPQESWTPIILGDGMVAFQNVYEKYLSVDEVAGGTLALRGDSEEIGYAERFLVKVQARFKKEVGDEERKKKMGETKRKIDEVGSK